MQRDAPTEATHDAAGEEDRLGHAENLVGRRENPTTMSRAMRVLAPLSCLLALVPASCVATESPPREAHVFERQLMGSRFRVTLVGSSRASLEELAEECFELARETELLASNWQPESAVERLNADPRAGAVAVEPELAELLRACTELCRETGGAFDVTVGSLLHALGYYAGEGSSPTAAELEQLLARTGCDVLRVEGERVVRTVDGVRIDLGGVAKGWAVDRMVAHLRAAGVRDAFVEGGPSVVFALGDDPDDLDDSNDTGAAGGWTFAPATGNDTGSRRSWGPWVLHDEALATSGQLSQPIFVDGRLASHIVDPRSGLPVEHATVLTAFVAPSAAEADMGSTALLVLGSEAARAWITPESEGRAALLVDAVPPALGGGTAISVLGNRAGLEGTSD